MTLVIEVIVGILLALWVKNKIGVWRNRRNITKCGDVFLRATPSDLIHYAIDSEEFIYTRNERMYLLELAIETDESTRRRLAEGIAQNAAGRLLALMEGKSQPSVMTDLDKLWLKEMEVKMEPWRLLIRTFDTAKTPLNNGVRQNIKQVLEPDYDLQKQAEDRAGGEKLKNSLEKLIAWREEQDRLQGRSKEVK